MKTLHSKQQKNNQTKKTKRGGAMAMFKYLQCGSQTSQNKSLLKELKKETPTLKNVRYWIECGANVNVTDSEGNTPLILASEKGKVDIMGVLIEHHADLETRNNKKENALYLAFHIKTNYLEAMRLLLEKGANVDATFDFGEKDKKNIGFDNKSKNETLLTLSCYRENNNRVKLLLEFNANIEHKTSNYKATPLMIACSYGYASTVSILLEKGANIEAKDDYGYTPLFLALENHHDDNDFGVDMSFKIKIIKLLLEKGANIEAKNNDGETPLLWLCNEVYYEEDLETILLFIKKGANISAVNNKSKTAYDLLNSNNAFSKENKKKLLPKLLTT